MELRRRHRTARLRIIENVVAAHSGVCESERICHILVRANVKVRPVIYSRRRIVRRIAKIAGFFNLRAVCLLVAKTNQRLALDRIAVGILHIACTVVHLAERLVHDLRINLALLDIALGVVDGIAVCKSSVVVRSNEIVIAAVSTRRLHGIGNVVAARVPIRRCNIGIGNAVPALLEYAA